MSIRRLKCFIAMPFDRADTDNIYKLVYKKILRTLKITEVRVDMKEHNKNINDFIIEEIKKSDFIISDLTYARPSVYYESGYGERVIPIIYTVRKDHFKPKSDDPNGNLAVHFDVSMRNIIFWEDDMLSIFSKKLDKRIRHVTKPIISQLKNKNKNKEEEDDFKKKSEIDKIELIKRPLILMIRKKGFHKLIKHINYSDYQLFTYGIYGQIVNNVLRILHFNLCKKVNGNDVRSASYHTRSLSEVFYKKEYFKQRIKRVHTIEEHQIICSIDKFNVDRIKQYNHNYKYGSDNSELIIKDSYEPIRDILHIKNKRVVRKVRYRNICHFVCGVKSKNDVKNRFLDALNKI